MISGMTMMLIIAVLAIVGLFIYLWSDYDRFYVGNERRGKIK
jgi:uncharacterized membrane protein YqiK